MTLTCEVCGRIIVEDESAVDETQKYIECTCGARGLNPFYVGDEI